MAYKQLIPAGDWYYKFGDVVWNVAAFAVNDDDEVIGLVGAGNKGTLIGVPRSPGGAYLHRNQLTAEEIELADKKR
jgi:hypothetical protein